MRASFIGCADIECTRVCIVTFRCLDLATGAINAGIDCAHVVVVTVRLLAARFITRQARYILTAIFNVAVVIGAWGFVIAVLCVEFTLTDRWIACDFDTRLTVRAQCLIDALSLIA